MLCQLARTDGICPKHATAVLARSMTDQPGTHYVLAALCAVPNRPTVTDPPCSAPSQHYVLARPVRPKRPIAALCAAPPGLCTLCRNGTANTLCCAEVSANAASSNAACDCCGVVSCGVGYVVLCVAMLLVLCVCIVCLTMFVVCVVLLCVLCCLFVLLCVLCCLFVVVMYCVVVCLVMCVVLLCCCFVV
jgi:hypothetical protein